MFVCVRVCVCGQVGWNTIVLSAISFPSVESAVYDVFHTPAWFWFHLSGSSSVSFPLGFTFCFHPFSLNLSRRLFVVGWYWSQIWTWPFCNEQTFHFLQFSIFWFDKKKSLSELNIIFHHSTRINKTLQALPFVFHGHSANISSPVCTPCLSRLPLSASSRERKCISLIGSCCLF